MPARAGAEPPSARSRPGVPAGPVGSPSGVRTFTVKLRVTRAPAATAVSGSRERRVSPVMAVRESVAAPSRTVTSYVPGGTSKWQPVSAQFSGPSGRGPGRAWAGTAAGVAHRVTVTVIAVSTAPRTAGERLTRDSSALGGVRR